MPYKDRCSKGYKCDTEYHRRLNTTDPWAMSCNSEKLFNRL